eukprot:TRINITY_DN5798_c0_g1_i1.p1 TRINITY_DN5798_c0_g1~~TRINITY_DN5798_c0_g1_i1.p1  ORF type:complete len:765 (+),score=153.00 TRINITY_DN5798_c0_g1_i1:101-2395(+)
MTFTHLRGDSAVLAPEADAQQTGPRGSSCPFRLSLLCVLATELLVVATVIVAVIIGVVVPSGISSARVFGDRFVTAASSTVTAQVYADLSPIGVAQNQSVGLFRSPALGLLDREDIRMYMVKVWMAFRNTYLYVLNLDDPIPGLGAGPGFIVIALGSPNCVFINYTAGRGAPELQGMKCATGELMGISFGPYTGNLSLRGDSRVLADGSTRSYPYIFDDGDEDDFGVAMVSFQLAFRTLLGQRIVSSVDVPLTLLSEKVRRLAAAEEGALIVILDSLTGMVVGTTDTSVNFLVPLNADITKLLQWNSSYFAKVPHLQDCVAFFLKQNPGGFLSLRVGPTHSYVLEGSSANDYDDVQVAFVRSTITFVDIDLTVMVALPGSTLLSKIQTRVVTVISIVTGVTLGLLATTVAVWFFAFLRPLRKTAHSMQGLTRLRYSAPFTKLSYIREIQTLQQTFFNLQNGVQAFANYLPPTVVQGVLQMRSNPTLGMRPFETVVFFSDIVSFTSIAESIPPLRLVSLMEEYLGEMSAIVINHQGTVDKYIGDCVMAFWNAPNPVTDYILAAVRSAWECQTRLALLRNQWCERGFPSLFCRIGLNAGPALVGNFGSQLKMDYTVIGDTVNLASRLESLNKKYGTSILVSKSVVEGTRDEFLFRPLDRVAVKGKKLPTAIFELADCRANAPASEVESADKYAAALNRFWARKFPEARRLLEEFRAAKSACSFACAEFRAAPTEDLATDHAIELCDAYQRVPPPADWDGTNVMTEK